MNFHFHIFHGIIFFFFFALETYQEQKFNLFRFSFGLQNPNNDDSVSKRTLNCEQGQKKKKKFLTTKVFTLLVFLV